MPNYTDSLMINFIKRAPYKYARNLYEPFSQEVIDSIK